MVKLPLWGRFDSSLPLLLFIRALRQGSVARENGHAARTSQKPRRAWLSGKGCAYEEDLGHERSSLCTLHTDLWLSLEAERRRVEPLCLVKSPHFRFRELVLGEPPGALGGAWLALRPRRKAPED